MAEAGRLDDQLGPDTDPLRAWLVDCLTSTSLSYRYVLPTQLLCKAVDHSLDAHSLQVAWGKDGAFDARSVAHAVIVPFDRDNDKVLGGSPEPYVNNPLRCVAVVPSERDNKRDKKGWDKLVWVLDRVEAENDPQFTKCVFDQALIEIHRMLARTKIVYPVPRRISLDQTSSLVASFISEPSGGDRNEAVCTALLRTVASRFGIFDEIRRESVTAADTSSGMLADIECWQSGKIVLLVEVKGRTLTLTHLDSKLDTARANKISEILFVAENGKAPEDADRIDERIRSEFTSGHNVYVCDLLTFAHAILILLGEEGRVQLLETVGQELDRGGSAIRHRRAWAELLKGV